MQRPKASFGSLTAGQARSIYVDVALPPEFQAPLQGLQCTLSCKSRGLSLWHGAEELGPRGGAAAFAPGTNRLTLRLVYSPELEESMLGSLELECRADGTLLKGAVALTGKGLAPAPKAPPPRQPSSSSSAAAADATAKKKRSASVAQQPNSPALKAPLPPAPKLNLGALPPTPRLPAPPAASSGTTAATAAASTSAPVSSAAAAAAAAQTAVPDTKRVSDQQQLGTKRPAPSVAREPASKQQAVVPKLPLDLVRTASSSSDASGASSAAPQPQAREQRQKPARVKAVEAPSPPPHNSGRGGASRPAPQQGTGREAPAGPTTSATAAGQARQPSRASTAATTPPHGAAQDSVRAPGGGGGAGPPARALPAPRNLSLSGLGHAARSSPSASQAPQDKRGRSAYLTMHSELPLAKQERALVAWMNSHLSGLQSSSDKAIEAPSSREEGSLGGPTAATTSGRQAEPLSLQQLSSRCRGVLWRQYRDNQGIFDIISKIYGKVDGGYFNLTDTPLIADRQHTNTLTEPLLSYHPFWLRLGLVVILRDVTKAGGTEAGLLESKIWKRGMQPLLREVLMYEREMHASCDKAAFWRGCRDDILKHFLLLVLLLDKTAADPAASRLPKGVPPLFDVKAPLKSSKEVVKAFLNGRMRGIGDALHHLEAWGYRLEYVQAPEDDLDYSVTSLREDLRSGIRLAKLYEVLTGFPTLLGKGGACEPPLFLSPVTDQQRMGNMATVLDKLAGIGAVPQQGQRLLTKGGLVAFRARDVVDANRDVTLGMLWHVANKWQLPRLLSLKDLKVEVRRLLRLQQHQTRKPAPEPLDVYPGNARLSALMKWATALCALHGLRVTDFKSSFGDGRALCYMVHTYLPTYLPKDQIYQPDAPKPEDVAVLLEGDEEIDSETLRTKGWCAVYEAGGNIDDDGMLKSFKEGVQRNFQLVHGAAQLLGRVPEMLSADDFAGGLDEQSVVLYVAHLCSRLLEVSKEERAAAIITQAMRRLVWMRKYGVELEKKRTRSAVVIQMYWRGHAARRLVNRLRQQRAAEEEATREAARQQAATLIQACWRGHRARQTHGFLARFLAKCTTRHSALVQQRYAVRAAAAAVVVQRVWRGWRARRAYLEQHATVCRVQAQARMLVVRALYLQQRGAAVLIQRRFRLYIAEGGWKRRREEAARAIQARWRGWVQRQRFVRVRDACCVIQAGFKAYQVRALLALQRRAAVAVQSAWRAARARRAFLALKAAAVTVQAALRAAQARRSYLASRRAAAMIQGAWKGYVVRRQVGAWAAAATVVQAGWRGFVVRRQVEEWHAAATAVQAGWKGFLVRRQVAQWSAAATAVQGAWRGHVVRRRVAAWSAAATAIQAGWRGYVVRRHVAALHAAATAVQAGWRGYQVRRQVAAWNAAATAVQAGWRGYVARRQLAKWSRAATAIQGAWRGHVVRRRGAEWSAAAITIQAGWRGYLVRREVAACTAAATTIQAGWRGHAVRRWVAACSAAATAVQARWRGFVVRRQVAEMGVAATAVQAVWRGRVVRRQVASWHAAAATVQAVWRGHVVRQQAAAWLLAATTIQARWRGLVARRQVARWAAAATTIQAHVRGRSARLAFQRLRGAAVALQALWRRRQALLRRQTALRAAVALQSAWRRRGAVLALRIARLAAAALQAAVRGAQARARLRAQRSAAVCIQRCARGMLARRRAAAERGMREAVAEFQRTMVLYAKRLAAARLIQAAWKGFLVRREVRPLLRLAMQRTRQRQAAVAIQKTYRRHLAVKALQARKAALATISRYVPVFRARMRLFAARALTRRRHCAATVVQSYVHMWLAQRLRRTLLKGFTRLQALWRGHQARRRCGRSMAEVRRKLRAASEAGAQAPHKHIGVRLREAIGVLLAKKEPEKVSQPMMCVERFCQVSRACCKVVASDPSTLSELLRHLRRCNRSKPHEPTLHSLLGVLSAVCRYADLLPAVFRADDCVETLSEKLQMFRDTEEVFLPTVSILHRLLSVKLHAVEIASKPEPLRTWEGIAQVLSRKMESERKYLERLEVRKGSDNAAKQSTNKVITAAKALHELQHLISLAIQAQAGGTAPPSALAGGAAAAGPSDKHAHHHPAEGATAGGAGAGAKRLPAYVEPVPAELVQPAAWQAKNTLVRDALKEITTRHHLQAAQATASAAAMAAAVAAGGGDPVVLLSLTAPLAPALAATGDAAGSSVQKGQQQLGGLGSPHRKKSPRAQAK